MIASLRSNGFDVKLIEGNRGNIKVTTPEDYIDLLARLSAEDQKQIFELYYQVQSYEQEGPVKRR